MALHRTQVLLEPAQHRALEELASQEARSLSDLVREAVDQLLAQRGPDALQRQRHAAILALDGLRESVRLQKGVVAAEWLEAARSERASELETAAKREA